MTVNLPISRLVNFGVVITPQLIQAPSLNTGLVLGTSAVIDVVSRMRIYNTLAAVATDFGTSAEEYLSAVAWFAQSPQPTSLNIGRWAKTASAGQLFGGTLTLANQLLAAWTSINNGGFAIGINGAGPQQVANLDFTAQTNFNGIASVLTSGFPGGTAVVTWDAIYKRFIATTVATGVSAALSFATPPNAGTDISAMLAWSNTAGNGAYVAGGVDAESALAAVVLFDNMFGGQWYNLYIPSSSVSDQEAIAPYVDGSNNPHFFWITSQDATLLAAGSTSNIGYVLQQFMAQHTAVQYCSTSLYAAWSMAARIATVNWNGSNTALSLMYKQEPGIIAEVLNATQAAAIDSYDVNVYVNYSGYPQGAAILEQGICPSGQFIDTIVGTDGLRTQMMVNVFNILFGAATKIPQTDAGVTTLETGVEDACTQYIVNGLGAPGVWNTSGFGTLTQGQYLDKGYYIYTQPVATQSEAQRQIRVCPPIQVAFKLAGAIDTVSGTIFVNQ